jgi:hypothetical protein
MILKPKPKSTLFTAIATLLVISTAANTTYASSDEELTDQEIDILAKCSDDGYEDGLNHPFDYERNKECDLLDKGAGIDVDKSTYHQAFIEGCKNAGNSEETCELNIE